MDKFLSHCFYASYFICSIFDQSEAAPTKAQTPYPFSQGYPQLLWISFQATFNANCIPFAGLEIATFLLRVPRRKRRLAIGETNST